MIHRAAMFSFDRQRFLLATSWILFGSMAGFSAPADCPAQANDSGVSAADDGQEADVATEALKPWETFIPDFEDNDLAGTETRAWEYRPYQVAVWFCLDGSPSLNSVYTDVASEVTRRSELLDPSGWDFTTGKAPARFRSQLLRYIDQPARCHGLDDPRVLAGYDKLMVVCLTQEPSFVLARVREFDVQTQQWGPMTIRQIASKQGIGQQLMSAITVSFMPLSRIDGVVEIEYQDDEGKTRRRDEVVMHVRAIKSCVRTELREIPPGEYDVTTTFGEELGDAPVPVTEGNEDRFEWIARDALDAPAFVKPTDRFLPVIRRTDRKGNLLRLEPLEFTFLTVDSQEDSVLRASIESSQRAPLAQRASKRAEKLGLVIRPPKQSTRLRLVSTAKTPVPLEGFEIYSRSPGQPLGEESQRLGETDWRGEIEIPPSDDGLRLIYVKRGSRALKKLPIMTGLYRELQTTLPNDETRLYAEGVFQGLENEVLSLVIQRKVAGEEVAAAIKAGLAAQAKTAYQGFKELEALSEVKNRLNTAASDLKFQTNDQRELDYIDTMQNSLTKILDQEIRDSKEQEYLEQIQNLSAAARGETPGQ